MMKESNKICVYFDEQEYTAHQNKTGKLITMLYSLFEDLKDREFLHIQIETTMIHDVLFNHGGMIKEAYQKHLQPYIEQTNPLMRKVAQDGATARIKELTDILTAFERACYTVFNTSGDITACSESIFYNEESKKIEFDSDYLKEKSEVNITDEKQILFYQRIQKAVDEINAINAECKRMSNNRQLFTYNGNFNKGLFYLNDEGNLENRMFRFMDLNFDSLN